jgi:hypothetical protein
MPTRQGGLPSKERQHLGSVKPSTNDAATVTADTVRLEDVLRHV